MESSLNYIDHTKELWVLAHLYIYTESTPVWAWGAYYLLSGAPVLSQAIKAVFELIR